MVDSDGTTIEVIYEKSSGEIQGAYIDENTSDRRRDENIFTSWLQTDSLPHLLHLYWTSVLEAADRRGQVARPLKSQSENTKHGHHHTWNRRSPDRQGGLKRGRLILL